ncbi:hypothetical protein OQ968_02900 [Mycobacterium sp. 663a-19]|uniref:hypothetical protein n=1 Tax=Mycobacterium sp. 663a-19 TaxID=2986148 RepID=UPI002D1F35A0|nr:hypothetical protein [Mycobacterium sp. 663a-19]MEB3980209.1 hypothetical protein [Mycobacterium sp. 663a-19]
MPVRHTDFAFVEETVDPSEYPDEIRPTYGSDRFPFTVPKSKLDEDTLSKPALLLRDRIAEATGADPKQVPVGLLRAVEAADAWPDENVKNFASGRMRSISTEVGEIVFVDFWANPLALVHDPNNGRTIADARAKGFPYLEAVRDDPPTGAPVMRVKDAVELITGVEETAGALGFLANITDGKDLQDINWIGLQGVHEPTLIVPTLVEDHHGNATWILEDDDGNRRLAMQRRCLREATGLAISELEAWADHLYQPDATKVLRHWTAKDVDAVRRKSLYKDGKYWRPSSATREAIAGWLNASNKAQRTVIRNSVIPARLVVGYRNLNLKGVVGERSAAKEAVHRYIRRTHIKTAAQRDWSTATQAMQVALDSIRRIKVRYDLTRGYKMALSRAELDVVYANTVTDWLGTDGDDPRHPLRLAAKAIATFVCNDTTAEGDVKRSLTAHSLSTHATKIRENRASVAASVAMPILGLNVNDKGDYNRARAAVDRASRHPMFVAVKKHPNGATDPWWSYLDRSVDELLALADREFDEGMGADDSPDDKSVGTFGPASRALLFLATIGQATNPAFRDTLPGEQATPWQLTINALGGTRGNTMTTPDLVMRQVLAHHKKDGATQIAEMARAALASEIPRNTIDPDYVEHDDKGQPIERTRKTVTERFLRSEAMGWTARGGGDTPPPPAGDPFDRALAQLSEAVAAAAANTAPFLDAGDIGQRFVEAGLPDAYTTALLKQARKVVTLLQRGQFIAQTRRGAVVADFDDDEEEDQ